MDARKQLNDDWKGFEARGVLLEPLQFRQRPRGCSSDGLVVRPQDGPTWAMITELDFGVFGYVLEPFILQTGPGKRIIMDSWLVVPWEDPLIEWLPDPASDIPSTYIYSLGKTLEFPRKDVLNHKLKGELRRGDIRQGVLLGRGSMAPPDTYKDGSQITATLRVVDQWGKPYSAPFKMRLSRSPARRSAAPKRKLKSLFSSRDTVRHPSFAERYGMSAALSVRDPYADRKKVDSQIAEFEALMAPIRRK